MFEAMKVSSEFEWINMTEEKTKRDQYYVFSRFYRSSFATQEKRQNKNKNNW